MIELVTVTKKLLEKILFCFFKSFKCQSARKPKNYCEPPRGSKKGPVNGGHGHGNVV